MLYVSYQLSTGIMIDHNVATTMRQYELITALMYFPINSNSLMALWPLRSMSIGIHIVKLPELVGRVRVFASLLDCFNSGTCRGRTDKPSVFANSLHKSDCLPRNFLYSRANQFMHSLRTY